MAHPVHATPLPPEPVVLTGGRAAAVLLLVGLIVALVGYAVISLAFAVLA